MGGDVDGLPAILAANHHAVGTQDGPVIPGDVDPIELERDLKRRSGLILSRRLPAVLTDEGVEQAGRVQASAAQLDRIPPVIPAARPKPDRQSTRLNSSH